MVAIDVNVRLTICICICICVYVYVYVLRVVYTAAYLKSNIGMYEDMYVYVARISGTLVFRSLVVLMWSVRLPWCPLDLDLSADRSSSAEAGNLGPERSGQL